jgi:hypothetical protein
MAWPALWQRNPSAKLGIAAALALQVGGTLRRIGEVRRGQEEGLCSRGIDGHGAPPGWELLSMPRPGKNRLADSGLFFEGVA